MKRIFAIVSVLAAMLILAPIVDAKRTSHKKSAKSSSSAVKVAYSDGAEFMKFYPKGKLKTSWGDDGAYYKENDIYIIMDGHGNPWVLADDICYDLSAISTFDNLKYLLQSWCGDVLSAPTETLSDIIWFEGDPNIIHFRDGADKDSSYDLRKFPDDEKFHISWSK